MSKGRISLLLVLALLCGCAAGSGEAPDLPETPACSELAGEILCALDRNAADLERLDETLGPEGLPGYLTDLYGLPAGSWEDCAIYRAGGVEIFELAVLRLTAEADDAAVLAGLTAYIAARQGDFAGYAPDQAAIADQAQAVLQGQYAALLLCEDAAAAEETFLACLGGNEPAENRETPALPGALEPSLETPEGANGTESVYPGRWPYVQPGREDMTLYDTTAILAAWRSGDTAGLSERNRAILTLAEAVLSELLTEDMSAYDRERAVYAWITGHVIYDQTHYDPLAVVDPDSATPYGPLQKGKGICLGFASLFQLLMDMAEVECITVVGAAFHSLEDHAWNMVRLDGGWYCVDAAWDAEAPPGEWRYFNVTSDYMARTDHQWNYAEVPEAAG